MLSPLVIAAPTAQTAQNGASRVADTAPLVLVALAVSAFLALPSHPICPLAYPENFE